MGLSKKIHEKCIYSLVHFVFAVFIHFYAFADIVKGKNINKQRKAGLA